MINPFLYWRTLKHLKQQQIKNRITRKIKSQLHISSNYELTEAVGFVQMQVFPPTKESYKYPNTFKFLDRSKSFDETINWNTKEHGKLWTYHLNYLECLLQQDLSKSTGLKLIKDYIANFEQIKDGKEPYPTSLRLIHVIKFLSKHQHLDVEIDMWLGKQALLLKQSLEFHLLANHLLENGFSLLFVAYHLQDTEILSWASTILEAQLAEQVLNDGAHFELSPLYHCIIFSRVLDAYNLVITNKNFTSGLENLLSEKATLMYNWLTKMMVNGHLPPVNDTFDVSPTDITKLLQYAYSLNIDIKNIDLCESGYRFLKSDTLTCLFDVGNIGPDYNPGHAHADTLQFLLWINHEPVIVDTGVSTYEANPRRELERSTASHNTVEVDQLDSSEVWSSFRVGDRANIIHLDESDNEITASHDGYRHLNVIHKRTVTIEKNELKIKDILESNKSYSAKAHLHFHPDQNPRIEKDKIQLKNGTVIIDQAESIKLIPYKLANGYNKTIDSLKAEINFNHTLLTRIQVF